MRALPGVTNAAYISGLPMVWGGGIWPVGINGVELERRDDNTASMRFVTPGLLRHARRADQEGARRQRQRHDDDADDGGGQRITRETVLAGPGRPRPPVQLRRARPNRSSASSSDIRVRGLERNSEPQVYLPYRQVRDGRLWGYTPKELVIRATARSIRSCRRCDPSSRASIRSSRSPTCGR